MSSPSGVRIQRALQAALVNSVLGNERIAREFGLLATDLQALHLLVLREEVRTPKQLSQATNLPTSTVTRVVDRLERAGYIRRVDDPQDRRKTNIQLVADNVDTIISHYDQFSEGLDRTNSTFSEDELLIVARYLEQSGGTF